MIVAIITTAMATTTTPSSLPTRSSSCCSGVVSSARLFSMPGDAAHLGLHAGGGHDRFAAPVGRRRAAEDHVVAVAEPTSPSIGAVSFATGRLSPVSAASAVCSAVDSIRRASAGMVSPSSIRMMSPGTTSAAGNAAPLAVAHDGRVRRRHRAQRRHRRLRARLLNVSHDRVEQDDREDRDRFVRQATRALEHPEDRGDRCGDEQQDDEHIRELREELPPRRDRLLRGELVAPSRSSRARASASLRPRRASVASAAMSASAGC